MGRGFALKLLPAVLALAACLGAPAQAEKRVALVIGNSAYRNVTPLDNPKSDARLMADTLRGVGFTLIGGAAQIDLDKAGFDDVLQKFGNALIGADVALFYYAGHGVQVRGSNYLVPVGANPAREADVLFQMVDSALVLAAMEGSGTGLNLVILDACRNNPFAGRGLRATAGGLAQMQAPQGTLISYATQPGNVALDGADGNSPYTRALAQTIRKPGLGIFDAFNEVGLAVMQATNNSQQPWVSSSPIRGSFQFTAAPAQVAAPAPAPAPVTAPPPAPAPKPAVIATPATPRPSPTPAPAPNAVPMPPAPAEPDLDAAAAAWNAVRGSNNIAALQAFLDRYRDTIYGDVARIRIAELRRAQSVVTTPPLLGLPSLAVPIPAPLAADNSSEAGRAWDAVRTSTNIAVLQNFVERYRDTIYGDVARGRIEELKRSQSAAANPSTREQAPATDAPGSYEPRINREGITIADYNLPSPDARLCQKMCIDEKRCTAWVYRAPEGRTDNRPHCWLRNNVTRSAADNLTISGDVKR